MVIVPPTDVPFGAAQSVRPGHSQYAEHGPDWVPG